MNPPPYNILFLCTGNSARSILGEVALNTLAGAEGRFRGYSAGSFPKGAVNPVALQFLAHQRLPANGLRSKSWDEFSTPAAPRMDLIITVCDQAAGEQCPYWPGAPVTLHWGMPDPASVEGSDDEKLQAFAETYRVLHRRLLALTGLVLEAGELAPLKQRLQALATT